MLIITPNQRLAKTEKEKLKPAANIIILPIQQWLVQLWEYLIQQNLISPCYLLNDHQRNIIWQKIIERYDPSLTYLTSLAIKAWTIAFQNNINISDQHFNLKKETRFFKQWAFAYIQELNQNKWCDIEIIMQNIMSYFNNDLNTLYNFPPFLLPKKIVLLGFTDFSMQEKKLWQLLSQKGFKIIEQKNAILSPSIRKTFFANEDLEIDGVAQWACQQYNSHRYAACIFPELSHYKNKILAVFQRYFEDKDSINISLGYALNEYGLIKAALTGLSLWSEKSETFIISEFLLSPYFNFPYPFEKLSSRALLDQKIQPFDFYSLSLLLKTVFTDLTEISALENFLISEKLLLTPKKWADIFQKKLSFLGF